MRVHVESLKRLFEANKLTKEQIRARMEKGTITQEEYGYITEETEEV